MMYVCVLGTQSAWNAEAGGRGTLNYGKLLATGALKENEEENDYIFCIIRRDTFIVPRTS